MTTSASREAAAGSANRGPGERARAARCGLRSISSTSQPGTRDAPAEHQRLGAAADAAIERADEGVAVGGGGERLGPDLAAARLGDPERSRGITHARLF